MIRLESSKEGKQEGGNAKHRPVGHDSIISTGRRGRRAAATERAPARTEAHAANQAPDRRFEHDGIKGRAGRARGGGGARPRRAARRRSDHGSANGTGRREHEDRESTASRRSARPANDVLDGNSALGEVAVRLESPVGVGWDESLDRDPATKARSDARRP